MPKMRVPFSGGELADTGDTILEFQADAECIVETCPAETMR